MAKADPMETFAIRVAATLLAGDKVADLTWLASPVPPQGVAWEYGVMYESEVDGMSVCASTGIWQQSSDGSKHPIFDVEVFDASGSLLGRAKEYHPNSKVGMFVKAAAAAYEASAATVREQALGRLSARAID